MATPDLRTDNPGVDQVTVEEVGIFSQRDGDVLLSCDAALEAAHHQLRSPPPPKALVRA